MFVEQMFGVAMVVSSRDLTLRAFVEARRRQVRQEVDRVIAYLSQSNASYTSARLVQLLDLQTNAYALSKELGRRSELYPERDWRDSRSPTRWKHRCWD